MKAFGSSFSVTSFPSLINTVDLIYLSASEGSVVHTVNYTDEWYQNELKRQGGWSLEMKDINNPCEGQENWSASRSSLGGTPGRINSVDAVNLDMAPPRLLRATVADSASVLLWFNESLDSATAADINKYQISDGIGHPLLVKIIPPLMDKALLRLDQSLDTGKIYEVVVSGILDCLQNEIGAYRKVLVGVSASEISNELVINEVLFNPKNNGVDFVELVNKSNKVIDLQNIHVAHRDDFGNISDIQSISTNSYLCFPGDIVVITEDAFIIRSQY
jgi:hypothetical protein